MKNKKKERIVVAMSGGVDSSVAAYLLKKEGYEVIGVTMQLWSKLPKGCDKFGTCCSPEDIADARRVANMLDIPYYVVNLEAEFQKDVVDYFINSYLNGKTPNPCIPCNNKLKFNYLMKRARKIGAKKVATGHYSSIVTKRNIPLLKRGVDPGKDQSYFLFNLTRKQLENTLMPLGTYNKDEIRKIADELGLHIANKKDSQEICFIPDKDYASFIKENVEGVEIKEGDIVNSNGDVLGRHKGIIFYTIGQRKGLGIAHKVPLYVLKIDNASNRIIVGEKRELKQSELIARDVNWLIDYPGRSTIDANVQIRYRHNAVSSKIKVLSKTKVRVTFDEPENAPAPGQAAVFYNEYDEVLGGGWIE